MLGYTLPKIETPYWGTYENFRKIVLVDVDGTLADSSHRIHYLRENPKNWDSFFDEKIVFEDPPIRAVADLVRAIRPFYVIVIATGRPERLRSVTTEWLVRYKIEFDVMLMREDDDRIDDDVLKIRMAEVFPLDRIAFAIEDRNRIVKAYREKGIVTLQPRDGNF